MNSFLDKVEWSLTNVDEIQNNVFKYYTLYYCNLIWYAVVSYHHCDATAYQRMVQYCRISFEMLSLVKNTKLERGFPKIENAGMLLKNVKVLKKWSFYVTEKSEIFLTVLTISNWTHQKFCERESWTKWNSNRIEKLRLRLRR